NCRFAPVDNLVSSPLVSTTLYTGYGVDPGTPAAGICRGTGRRKMLLTRVGNVADVGIVFISSTQARISGVPVSTWDASSSSTSASLITTLGSSVPNTQ